MLKFYTCFVGHCLHGMYESIFIDYISSVHKTTVLVVEYIKNEIKKKKNLGFKTHLHLEPLLFVVTPPLSMRLSHHYTVLEPSSK